MWTPWRNKTGLAKAAVILATILSIATITCGLNLTLALNSESLMNFFIATGRVELAIMAASLVGLVVVLVIWLVSKVRGAMRKDSHD
jgi:hypothetical protein